MYSLRPWELLKSFMQPLSTQVQATEKGVLSITSQQAFESQRSVREEAEAEKKADHFWG